MKIISWNVNGIRAVVKNNFFETIKLLNPDILCIQETKAQNQAVKVVLTGVKDYFIYCNSAKKKGYSGVVLLSKIKPISIINDMGISKYDNEGRIICAEYTSFYLVTTYVPNSGKELKRLNYREKWDKAFLNYLKILEKKKPLIVCGDFNVAHQPIDLKNHKTNYNKIAGYTQVEIDGFNNIINAGFIDTFRFIHPEEISYTYWSYRFRSRERNTGWRIDYFLISNFLINKIKNADVFLDYYGSDHCPIGLDIDL